MLTILQEHVTFNTPDVSCEVICLFLIFMCLSLGRTSVTNEGTLQEGTREPFSGDGDGIRESASLPSLGVEGSGTASNDADSDLEDLLRKEDFLRISDFLRLDTP